MIRNFLTKIAKRKDKSVPKRRSTGLDFHRMDYTKFSGDTDFFSSIYNSEIDGLIISNTFKHVDLSIVHQMNYNLLKENSQFGFVIGRTLNGCLPESLDAKYFPETNEMTKYLDNLFGFDYCEFLLTLFYQLSSGKEILLPKNRSGQLYKPSTVRCLEGDVGMGMHVHIGSEFLNLSQLINLSEQIDLNSQMSFLFLVQEPEGGGELEIYNKVWEDTPQDIVGGDRVVTMQERREKFLEESQSICLDLKKGDFLLFDGGRIWHKVNAVEGSRSRITVGGFVALSKDHKTIYYWN